MRILNRVHVPWFIFVCIATAAAIVLYLANFNPEDLPAGIHLPAYLIQKPSDHRSVGGTPLGLIFGTISFAIFIFAALLSLRKKIPLWRIGTVQRWLRAHIWLTLLTIPLVILHSGFRFGGPMTTLLMLLYAIVMISGIYGLILQHQMPALMKERLPAETVFEQIPHIRAQLAAAAAKMRDSFKPATPTTDAGAPASSAAKAVTTGSTPMASTAGDLSTPTARAKTAVGSTITAEPITQPAPAANAATTETKPPETVSQSPAPVPSAAATDPDSELALVEFLDRQVIPYLLAKRGEKFRLGHPRFSEDTFRFVRLRIAEIYHPRVDEIQAWCDERRLLDLQTKMQHWLHGWLFVHVPFSFLLLMLTAWHAFVTLFYY
jgi:Tfp pilus assembly protein FimV